MWRTVETVAHFPANDWYDVITFKTPLGALSWNFVLDKEERLRERERGVGRLNRQLWTRGVSKHMASQKSHVSRKLKENRLPRLCQLLTEGDAVDVPVPRPGGPLS